jgi:hypothetical protein
LLREGNGVELVGAIREASRALVFISVPWSGPERQGREVFRAAVEILEQKADLGITFFRLEVDEDEASQQWLTSIGYMQFASMGAVSLIWLQSGGVLATEINGLSLGASCIVARSTSLWCGPGRASRCSLWRPRCWLAEYLGAQRGSRG